MTGFRVWAPVARTVEAEVAGTRYPMKPAREQGWWSVEVPGVRTGTSYGFVLDGGPPLPDPRGPHLPDGIHGLSSLYDQQAYRWADDGWHGRALAGSLVYELHVGTFTPEGTFTAAAGKLDHLVRLGVDIVELLPVHAFPGRHGWGYDVAALYAVHQPYGGPDGLKAFVDACHARGLAVALDVVYNHLGPDGAYVADFGPYLTGRYHTPWGPAVNLDGPGSDDVRRYLIDNALMWLRDFHIDGLRLDAVHAIVDTSASHLLEELSDQVDRLAVATGKTRSLVAESDLGDPRIVSSKERGGYGLDAQWSDDFHHALHVSLTGETRGYYADFARGLGDLTTALTHGFVYGGRHSSVRGRRHGRPYGALPGWRLLGYLQNHDQIGNRARGERSAQLLSAGLLRVAAALVLTAPFTPLLFMGEEWGATSPWQYFTDHDDKHIADQVRDARRAEFASFGWRREDVPDPQDAGTFARSKLAWAELEQPRHAALFDWYRTLVRIRRRHHDLASGDLASVDYEDDSRWLTVRRGKTVVVANLAAERQCVPVSGTPGGVLAASAAGWLFRDGVVELPGESVVIVELRPRRTVG